MTLLTPLRAGLAALLSVLTVTAATVAAEAPPAPPWESPLRRDHPLAGTIWLPGEKRTATADEVVAMAAAADFVLLGEKHDNADHHRLQAWVVKRLVAAGRKPAVAFEMFGTDQTATIARHLARHPRDARGIGRATRWRESGWPDWERHYGPIAQAALDAGMPIVGANLPKERIRAMAREGEATPEEVESLGLDQPLESRLHGNLVEELRESHCGHLPDTMISPMVMTQRAKDASMALSLVAAASAGADSAVLIAGNGHVRADRGVPLQLLRLRPDARVFTIGFFEVVAGSDRPEDYADGYDGGLPFDAVWFTPRVDEADPCEALARHMERKKAE